MERTLGFVSNHSIRKILLIIMIVIAGLGITMTALGTFSDEYTIERVSFTNETYYEKAEQYGDTLLENLYGPEYAGISLRPEQNQIFEINGFILTPKGYPEGYKFPVIIWSHGMIANTEFQLHYAMEFASAGFKVMAMGLEGHGSNGGLWDLGITDSQMFYSAVDYMSSLPDVNTSAIAVSGHSNGGYAAARSGIFDNTPLGTGGKIKAVGSIWTVSDFNETLQELVGANPINDPEYSWLIPMFMGTNNPDGVVTNEEILRRSVSHYINETNIPNWYLLSGSNDEFSSPPIMYNAMSNASGISMDTLETTVNTSPDETWNNTMDPTVSFANGTARKLLIKSGVSHVMEAFDAHIVQEVIDWFIISLNLDPLMHQSRMARGENVAVYWILRMGGFALMVAAFFLSQIVVSAYFAPIVFPERRLKTIILKQQQFARQSVAETSRSFLTPALQDYIIRVDETDGRKLFRIFYNNSTKKILFWSLLTAALALGISIFWRFNQNFRAFTRFWVFNAYLWQFLLMGIFVWILALVVYALYKRSPKYGRYVNLKRLGASWKGLGQGFIFVLVVVIAPVIVYDLLAWATAMPYFLPRPAQSGLWKDVIIGCGIIWFLYIPLETMIKTQLFPVSIEFGHKTGYWIEILVNAFVVFFIWVAAYSIGILTLHPKLFQMIARGTFGGTLFIAIVSIKPVLNIIIAFITAFMYQRTRNLFACSIYPVLIWALIIFGKLFSIYSFF